MSVRFGPSGRKVISWCVWVIRHHWTLHVLQRDYCTWAHHSVIAKILIVQHKFLQVTASQRLRVFWHLSFYSLMWMGGIVSHFISGLKREVLWTEYLDSCSGCHPASLYTNSLLTMFVCLYIFYWDHKQKMLVFILYCNTILWSCIRNNDGSRDWKWILWNNYWLAFIYKHYSVV